MNGETQALLARCLVAVPAYFAESTIGTLLRRLDDIGARRIVIVDDGSRDRTTEIAHQYNVDVITHAENRGYGGAQKSAYLAALESDCEYVGMIHGDLQYRPEALPDLLAPLAAGSADVCLGSRMLKGAPLRSGMPPDRWIMNRILTSVQNKMYGVQLTDFHTGFRTYRISVLRDIDFLQFSEDFRFDAQMLHAVLTRGIPVSEIPIPTNYGPGARSIGYRDAIFYVSEAIRLALRSNV